MSDASQDVPEAPGFIADKLASAIERMIDDWPADKDVAKVILEMTFDQWDELRSLLRATEGGSP